MRMDKKDVTPKLQEVQKKIYEDFQSICKRYSIPFFVSGGTAIGTLRHQGFIPWDDDIDICLLREDYNKAIHYIRKDLSHKYIIYDCKSVDGYVLTFAKMCKKGTKMQEDTEADTNFAAGIFVDLFAYDRTSPNYKERKKQIRRTWLWARLMVLSEYKHPQFPENVRGIKLSIAKIICLLVHYIFKLFRLKKLFFYKKYLKEARKYEHIDKILYTDFSYSEPERLICTKEMIFPLKEMPFEDITVQMLNDADKYLTSQFGNYMELPPEEQRKTHNPGYVDFGDGNIYKKHP